MSLKHKRIVLVTSSQPSLNPRMVKEADILSEHGYDVKVVGQYWNGWASNTDQQLLTTKKWEYFRVGGDPDEEKYLYLCTRFIHKIFRKLQRLIGLRYGVAELSAGRCSYLLYRKAVSLKGDLYIGHNPGGMAPAIRAAKRNKAKCGFDAEDFHRFEYSDDITHPDVKCKTYLEEKYFPKADYLITSSPQISKEYKEIFPQLTFNTVLNVFPTAKDLKVKPSKPESPIKIFWFSQTIGPNRGLDEAIEAIKLIGSPMIELHALGNPREQAISHYKNLAHSFGFSASQLTFYPPIAPDEIYGFAANFDIGLASEIGVPFNRTICLTNKIFTYIQAGLAVVASDTIAQRNLVKSYPGCGEIYKTRSSDDLARIFKHYLDNRNELNAVKRQSHEYGQSSLNWETESKKFVKIVEDTLGRN